jgi:lichenysin synthetase B
MWLTAPLFNRLVDQRPALFEPLRELLVGGDALSPAHVSRALDASPGLVIINGYGPTENTTFSTTHAIEASARGRIPIGRPIANSTAYLLGPDDQLAPIGAVGELCVGGDGLARGYLNRPELTARAFVASPLAEGERLYRTGDLARWRPDGAIEFLGRRDHQVKVRGFRIELGEVEAAVLEHPAVRETVVVARPRPDGADRYLCVYYVADRELQPGDLRAHLAHSLPDHMVASSYMELPALPLNDNGKVDRAALPEPSRAEREPVAPRTELEQRLVAIVEEQLRISGVGVCRDLRDLGMDSLSATVLAAEVERRTGIRPAVSEIVRAGTVEALARHLCAAGASGGPTLARMPRTATIPLSPQQWRIFVEQMKSPGATQYNVPVAVDLPADTDVVRLTRALGDLAARHDVLRTEFHFVDGEVRQRVAPGIVPDVEVRTGKLLASRAFVRPFDLSRAPLWRGLVTRAADRVRLLLDVHHIVIDGFSLAVLFEDLFALYDGVPLSDVAIQYSDYAHWVTGEAGARRRRAQGAHWMAVFAEPTPTLDLPTDFPRAAVRGHDGDVVTFDLGPEQVGGLRRLARHESATLFAVLAAIHAALLARVTGEPDVTVGTPISGRDVPGSGRVVGMFANTVCLRTRVDANMPFVELVRVVSAVADDAARHGDYPFDDLVSDVGARRDDGRHPLFDALIALQSQRYLEVEFRGRRRLELDLTGPTPFDLNLQIYELDGSLRLGWQFASALFHRGTVEAFRDLFLHIVAGALADPGTPVGRLTTAGPAPTLPHIQFNF